MGESLGRIEHGETCCLTHPHDALLPIGDVTCESGLEASRRNTLLGTQLAARGRTIAAIGRHDDIACWLRRGEPSIAPNFRGIAASVIGRTDLNVMNRAARFKDQPLPYGLRIARRPRAGDPDVVALPSGNSIYWWPMTYSGGP